MLWERIFRLRMFLVMLLAIFCFVDIAVTYFALKTYDFFLEYNPIADKIIKIFGLEITVLIIMPMVHIGIFLVIYYVWGFLHKEGSKIGLRLVTIGFFMALFWRFFALCFNFREFYRTFV